MPAQTYPFSSLNSGFVGSFDAITTANQTKPIEEGSCWYGVVTGSYCYCICGIGTASYPAFQYSVDGGTYSAPNNGASVTVWAATTAYTTGQVVSVFVSGALYNHYICTVAGTSGSTAPTGTTINTSYTDGTVTWNFIGQGISGSSGGSIVQAVFTGLSDAAHTVVIAPRTAGIPNAYFLTGSLTPFLVAYGASPSITAGRGQMASVGDANFPGYVSGGRTALSTNSRTISGNAVTSLWGSATFTNVAWAGETVYLPGQAFTANGLQYGVNGGHTSFNNKLWTANNPVIVGSTRWNGGNFYICTTAGVTASSGGPTGTGTSISDGTAVWTYPQTYTAGVVYPVGTYVVSSGNVYRVASSAYYSAASGPNNTTTTAVITDSNSNYTYYFIPQPWVTGTVYGANAIVTSNGNVYQTTAGGTAGATAPTGTGSPSDGGVTWTYKYSAFTYDLCFVNQTPGVIGFGNHAQFWATTNELWIQMSTSNQYCAYAVDGGELTYVSLWQANKYVNPGDVCFQSGGNFYVCTSTGKTAASGGPTGAGGSITDNTATWAYSSTLSSIAAPTMTSTVQWVRIAAGLDNTVAHRYDVIFYAKNAVGGAKTCGIMLGTGGTFSAKGSAPSVVQQYGDSITFGAGATYINMSEPFQRIAVYQGWLSNTNGVSGATNRGIWHRIQQNVNYTQLPVGNVGVLGISYNNNVYSAVRRSRTSNTATIEVTATSSFLIHNAPLTGYNPNVGETVTITGFSDSSFNGSYMVTAVRPNGTSSTSNTIGTGSKSFTISTGLGLQTGDLVQLSTNSAPTTTYVTGTVTSYNSGTGALVMNATGSFGSGTFTDWIIPGGQIDCICTGSNVSSTTDAAIFMATYKECVDAILALGTGMVLVRPSTPGGGQDPGPNSQNKAKVTLQLVNSYPTGNFQYFDNTNLVGCEARNDGAVFPFGAGVSSGTAITQSWTIGTGAFSCTAPTGLTIPVGSWVTLVATASANTTNWIRGQVVSYNSGTGALSFYVSDFNNTNGSGTFSTWYLVQGTAGTHADEAGYIRQAHYWAPAFARQSKPLISPPVASMDFTQASNSMYAGAIL